MSDTKTAGETAFESVADAVRAAYEKLNPAHTELGSAPLNLAKMGVNHYAYLKPDNTEDGPTVYVYAANGDLIGTTDTLGEAFKALKRNGMTGLYLN